MEAAQTIILSAMDDVKISGKLRRFLFWVGGPLFCLLILYGLRIYSGSSTNGAAETTGYPVYISDLFVSGNEVFMLRTRGESSIPRKYDIYRVGQDGQEQYVQPYPGRQHTGTRTQENYIFYPGWKSVNLIRLQDGADPIYWNEHMKKSVQWKKNMFFCNRKFMGRSSCTRCRPAKDL